MALVTASELRLWANPSMDTTSDSELGRAISAAQDLIGGVTGRVLEKTAYSTVLSGTDAETYRDDEAYEVIYLPSAHRPVEYSTSFSLSEDGISLTHTSGYSLTVGTLIKYGNLDRRMELVRVGTWSKSAPNNIAVSYNAGFTTSSLPPAVKQLIYELAWLLFKSPAWLGASNVSGQGGSVSFEKELTPQSQWTINMLRGGGMFS